MMSGGGITLSRGDGLGPYIHPMSSTVLFSSFGLVSSELGLRFSWVIRLFTLPEVTGRFSYCVFDSRLGFSPNVTGRKVIPVHCLEESVCLG